MLEQNISIGHSAFPEENVDIYNNNILDKLVDGYYHSDYSKNTHFHPKWKDNEENNEKEKNKK